MQELWKIQRSEYNRILRNICFVSYQKKSLLLTYILLNCCHAYHISSNKAPFLLTHFYTFWKLKNIIKDGAHYCYCAHVLRMIRWSRATWEKCATRRTRGLVLSPLSLGGSGYFLWKRCVVFREMRNNLYLPCQFFENRRSMCMLLFLPVWSIWPNIL